MRAISFAILVISFLISPPLCRGNSLFDAQISVADKPPSIVLLQNRQPYHDAWTAPDKFDHFLGSAMLGGSGFLALKVTHHDVDAASMTAFGVTVGVGIIKELYDMTSPAQHSSWRDLTVDIAGALLGVLLAKSF